jgi:hypothetical protein
VVQGEMDPTRRSAGHASSPWILAAVPAIIEPVAPSSPIPGRTRGRLDRRIEERERKAMQFSALSGFLRSSA